MGWGMGGGRRGKPSYGGIELWKNTVIIQCKLIGVRAKPENLYLGGLKLLKEKLEYFLL